MNKTILIIGGVLVFAVGGYFIGTSLKTENNSSSDGRVASIENIVPEKPERKAEIYGKVKAIVGNEITITKSDPSKDPTINMTSEEKRVYMKSLDEATRTALKEEILNATLGDVKVLVVIGTPMTKKTAQGPDASIVEGTLADLKVGGVVSIWLNNEETERSVAEFVKISFIK